MNHQPSLFPPPSQSTQPPPVRVIDERDTAALEWVMVALWQFYPYPEASKWPRVVEVGDEE